MAVFPLRETIMFRCMGWGGQVSNAIRGKKLTESKKLTTIIRIKVTDFGFELGLSEWFKGLEDGFDIGHFEERKEPSIPSEVVY